VAQHRVLVAGLPALLADVVAQALSAEPAVAAVRVVERAANQGDAQIPRDSTVVIVSEDYLRARPLSELLAECPAASVIVLEGDGDSAALAELWPCVTALGEPSPERVRAAVRRATPWRGRFEG
jgi:hypothetical protein